MEQRKSDGTQNTSDTINTNASQRLEGQESKPKQPVDEPVVKQVQVSVSNQMHSWFT